VKSSVRRMLDAAEDDQGVIVRSHARRQGLSDAQIDACVRAGLLISVAPGIYRVRGVPRTVAMATAAAVLGTESRAADATAARILCLDAPLPISPLHVTIDVAAQHPRLRRLDIETEKHAFFGVRVHRCRELDDPTPLIDGLRCSDAARTLIDIAPHLDAEALEATFERARRLGLLSIEVLARRFAGIGGRGRPGTPAIRNLLAHTAPNALDSKLEVKAWRLLVASAIETPVRQFPVTASGHRYRLDFAWPDLLATFETEGFEWHGSRARWKQDRLRIATRWSIPPGPSSGSRR
jgi:hypothetical protein